MKKLNKIIFSVTLILMMFLFVGCSGAKYSISGGPTKTTIEVSADDGNYGEAFVMDINKNKIVKIDSQLEKGELQIDFAEVINTATGDEPDDYEIVNTIKTINIKPGDQVEVDLDFAGEFMPTLTAVGETSGTVVISIEKKS